MVNTADHNTKNLTGRMVGGSEKGWEFLIGSRNQEWPGLARNSGRMTVWFGIATRHWWVYKLLYLVVHILVCIILSYLYTCSQDFQISKHFDYMLALGLYPLHGILVHRQQKQKCTYIAYVSQEIDVLMLSFVTEFWL